MAIPDERQEPVTDEFDEDIHEVPSHTPDFRTELAEELARLVPEAVADGRIDVEKLRELLDDDAANDGRERFGLMWPGKSRALRAAQVKTTATLVPDRENSKDWDTTQNVFIEGDNLEGLKILQKHYHGKIKMIYIDPPYNTGNDFIYPDNYREGLQTYLEWTKQVSEDGKKLSSNPESAGRYHSNWLNMMYPRLKLARNLLSEDGMIFVSIDDHEDVKLRQVLEEVFGESNFVGRFVWKKGGTGKNDSRFAVVEHEYVIAYARDASVSHFALDPDGRTSTSYNRSDEAGNFSLIRLDSKTLGYIESLDFEITDLAGNSYWPEQPKGKQRQARWRWSRSKVESEFDSLVFENGYVYTKNYEKSGAKPRSILYEERFGVTRTGAAQAERVMGIAGVFDYPKPVSLIRFFLNIASSPDCLVLDFFSGSGTTAHAVMQLNAEDGGSRRHIQVQLPEPVGSDSEAAKAGFATIADVSRERIRRAGQKIQNELGEQISNRVKPLDVGFRSYKLADTSFAKWSETSGIEQFALEERLAGLRGSADDNATPEMLLTELLLKQGYSLTESVSQTEIAGLRVWSVAEGAMLAIMDEHVKPSLEQLRAVVEAGPVRLVILEDVFAGDDQLKTNLVQHAKTHGVELWSA